MNINIFKIYAVCVCNKYAQRTPNIYYVNKNFYLDVINRN